MTKSFSNEGLRVTRLLMVLSSLAPLFVLWAIRGIDLIPDKFFLSFCMVLAIVPTGWLYLRICLSKKSEDKHELTADTVRDHKDHVLVYLFAILLPFYREEIATCRDLAAMVVALLLIIFLFFRFNLYYMNIVFPLFSYHVFSISSLQDNNHFTGQENFVIITPRRNLSSGTRLTAYRLSNTVYLEKKEND